jgi:deazaflavin-dependent oxidoreductase (nitroreductase family)
MSIGNTFTAAVLRSPLHKPLSNGLLLLSYQGRRSGKRYELPLQYLESDGSLYIWAGNAETKTWWRNFEAPAAVAVRLRGKDVDAKASMVDDPTTRADLLGAYVERYPYTTPNGRPRFFGDRWHPTDEELADLAESVVIVVIEPG